MCVAVGILVSLAGLSYGAVLSVFPAIIGDSFGAPNFG